MTEGYRPNIKGVIFDKDGTLYNYSQVWGPVVKDYVDTILKTFSVRNEKKARQEIFEIIGVDNRGNHYPDGLLFNHDKIEQVYALGYQDESQMRFADQLAEQFRVFKGDVKFD